MTKSAYTVNELSQEIGIGRSKIYDLIKEKKLRARDPNLLGCIFLASLNIRIAGK